MKEIDNNGLLLCSMQARIFADTVEHTDCSSAVFIRRYMLSDFVKRMDSYGALCESFTEEDVYAEIEKEYGKTSYGKEKYSYEELYWMGYIYRYWCCVYETQSWKVYRIILPKDLRKLYFPYHSLDPQNAIERILEARGIKEEDPNQKGVEIQRKILNGEYGKKTDKSRKTSR